MEKEYRLVQKKNGAYVLQIKEVVSYVDYKENKMKNKSVWKDTPTIKEA